MVTRRDVTLYSRGVGVGVGRWTWVAMAFACVGCRPTAPAPAAMTGDDAGKDAAAEGGGAAVVPDAELLLDAGAGPPLGAIERVRFSRKGRLAFVSGHDSFAVVDTKSGLVRRYGGEPPMRSELGFDNRCGVSSKGYMPDIDVYFAATDASEDVFWREEATRTGFEPARSVREDFTRGSSLRVFGTATVHASASTVTRGPAGARTTGLLLNESNVVRPLSQELAASVAVDSDDPTSRTALVRQNDAKVGDGGDVRSTFVLDPLTGPALSFPLWRGSKFRDAATWVSFRRSLLVALFDDEVARQHLCAFDLTTPGRAPACVPFMAPSPFLRTLVSEDGRRIAVTERVMGRPTPGKTRDENDERDTSKDECFLHVLDRRTGKDTRWKGVCTTTTEVPLRFEGEVLVTDAAEIVRCRQSKLRSYDVAAGGTLKSETLGPPASDDVDDKLLAIIEKDKGGMLPYMLKQKHWPKTYGHEQLVTWSEHDSVLARDGGRLRVCKKRGGACRDVATNEPIDADAVGGAALDVPVLGAASRGRFVAIDARSGTKLVDVALATE